VRKGHYNGTLFHRVMPNFMIQGGGMTPDMNEKPTDPPIRNEARNGLRNSRGTVAMARTNDPNSATAQFFINLKDNAFLDFGIRGMGYAVFGQVLEGMEIVGQDRGRPDDAPGPARRRPRHARADRNRPRSKAAARRGRRRPAPRVRPSATPVTPGGPHDRPPRPSPLATPRPSPTPHQ
jgi:cyclophilin family peptidyl-prolyl cis-trans isomerase